MSLAFGIAVYLTMWWTVLFAILPWGVHSQSESHDVVEGTDPGAPVAPRLLIKAAVTTGVTAVLWLCLDLWIIYFPG